MKSTLSLMRSKEETQATPESVAGREPQVPVKEVVVFKTAIGEMVAELWPEVAPKTVQNFKKLSGQGFFDGTAFHRIVKGFMIQGGDPLTKDVASEDRFGEGGPGYTLKDEFNPGKHVRGVLSMANMGRPNSAGSQFFICLGGASYLDNKSTAFGNLIKGEDVLLKIGETPVIPTKGGENSKPDVRVEVESVKIVAADSIP